jgi:nucleoside-diphosphate-sugar epimerase
MSQRILVTGASGCIGHYISETLIQNTNHELYLLVRNPEKLQIDTTVRPGITVLQGDMLQIEKLADLLRTIDIAVLTATAWGGEDTFEVNVVKMLELLNLLDAQRCQQVIYFSTASILDSHRELLQEAGSIGTDYIRSKYDCLAEIKKLAIAPKVTTLYPTLVVGGDAHKPYSHLTSGLPEVAKWGGLIRFLQADGSFHFIHGQDIAEMVLYLIEHPLAADESHSLVLGQARLTVDEAIAELGDYLGKNTYFRVPLSSGLANVIIVLFRIQMAAWDRFCMNYRHFTYDKVVNPGSFGLSNHCVTMSDVLKMSGVQPAK